MQPGDAPGTLNIVGNYIQTGAFNLDLGGTAAGTFDLLNVTGFANIIGGTLNVTLVNGFFPVANDTFTFLTSGGARTGMFSTVNGLNIGGGLEFVVVYNPNSVEIETEPLPTTDHWHGGADVWSNASKWSIGVPTAPDDVFIYSGGNDLVTLDVGSSTVNSLTVGGASNGLLPPSLPTIPRRRTSPLPTG